MNKCSVYYSVDYWYIMNDDGSFQKYDFSKPITSNLIIYAKWEIYLTATSVIPYKHVTLCTSNRINFFHTKSNQIFTLSIWVEKNIHWTAYLF